MIADHRAQPGAERLHRECAAAAAHRILGPVGLTCLDHRRVMLILGLAYKPNVDDERQSPSYVLMDFLQQRGSVFVLFSIAAKLFFKKAQCRGGVK